MKNRLLEIRKSLHLNQLDFGAKLKMSKATISALETGLRVITEKNIKLICDEFNINEEWFRTGNGKMFNDTSFGYELGSFASKATELDKQLITEWMKLDQNVKGELLRFIKIAILKESIDE